MLSLSTRTAVIVALLLLFWSSGVLGQVRNVDLLQTRAERTNFVETSRYEDVEAMTDAIAASSERIHKTYFGYTQEGRALPLLVVGDVKDATADAVLASGKTRVYVQANIHAGEVCGKEALLMLLRDFATGRFAAWTDSLVVLIAPIYNADGNERVLLTNRGLQNGPTGGMGQRPNAQGFDLNRDHMKLDSPEARSLVRFLTEYDPHVAVDLHTTNGTYHGYHVTYSPPLHPNTPPMIDGFLRDTWLPEVTSRIRAKYGWEYYHYGNVPRRGEPGWYTFDHRPRFNNNYAGLRNRFAILSEAYAYLSFEDRVLASRYFVEEILQFAYENATRLKNIVAEADALPIVGTELALSADFAKSDAPVDILMSRVRQSRNSYSGERILERVNDLRTERMYEYVSFAPTTTEVVPKEYFVLPGETVAIARLHDHGIVSRILVADSTITGERFRIDSVRVAQNEYQGHNAQEVFGGWVAAEVTAPAGTAIVDLNQPLGRLAFALLEPRFDDGFASWAIIDLEQETSGGWYPIFRRTKSD